MIHKFLCGVGFVLFMVGACGMDSESIVVPSAMILIGLMILFAESRNEEK